MNPDEGRNAEVAREVVDYGHWIPPTIAGRVRYEKPPLFYWAVAISFKIFGKNEFAARFVSALSGLICVLIIYMFGKKMKEPDTGLVAGLILSSTFIFIAFARLVIFDMLLTTLIVAAIYLFWLSEIEGGRGPFFASATFCTLSILTKGPIGLIISAMALLPLCLFHRRIKKFIIWALISFAASIPLFLIIELKSPGYCYKFFWVENVLRYLTPVSKREKPIYYYLLVFLIGFFPWSLITISRLREIKKKWNEHRETLTMLICWGILPFIFFTFSKAKMSQYVLPAFPAWALLLAVITEQDQRDRYTKLALLSGSAILIFFLLIVPQVARRRSMKGVERLLIKEKRPYFVNFKTKDYTAMFYAGVIAPKIRDKKIMCELIKEKGIVYIITKRNKIHDLSDCNISLKVLGKFNKLVLLKASAGSFKDHSPAQEPKQDGT